MTDNYKLTDEKTGAEINIGDTVTTFRGEKYLLVDFSPPRHPASSGRVTLADDEGNASDYFPGVINARIEQKASADTKSDTCTLTGISETRESFHKLAEAFSEAIAMKHAEGGYIEIIRGDELIWDSKNGRSNV